VRDCEWNSLSLSVGEGRPLRQKQRLRQVESFCQIIVPRMIGTSFSQAHVSNALGDALQPVAHCAFTMLIDQAPFFAEVLHAWPAHRDLQEFPSV